MKVIQLRDFPPAIAMVLACEPIAEGNTRPQAGSDGLVTVLHTYLAQDPVPEVILDFSMVKEHRLNGFDIGDLIAVYALLDPLGKTPILTAVPEYISRQMVMRVRDSLHTFPTIEEAAKSLNPGASSPAA